MGGSGEEEDRGGGPRAKPPAQHGTPAPAPAAVALRLEDIALWLALYPDSHGQVRCRSYSLIRLPSTTQSSPVSVCVRRAKASLSTHRIRSAGADARGSRRTAMPAW